MPPIGTPAGTAASPGDGIHRLEIETGRLGHRWRCRCGTAGEWSTDQTAATAAAEMRAARHDNALVDA